MAIKGEIENLKKGILEELESFYEAAIPVNQLVTMELAESMVALTEQLGREIAVYINRQGAVIDVVVGDDGTVSMPEIKKRQGSRLSGVRCIHTHPSSDTRLSGPDISSLRSLRFDAMAAIGRKQDGQLWGSVGFLTGREDEAGILEARATKQMPLKRLNRLDMVQLVMEINKEFGKHRLKNTEEQPERAVLAGISFNNLKDKWQWRAEDSLEELASLAETAGAIVVGTSIQRKDKPDNAFFLGKGKVDEIALAAQGLEADLLIIDDEISPSQQRNLELATGLRVIDRTALILDIFAQRARSMAGKLQVELAQLKYNLPRLGGQGLVLSRQGGGIGTRGPGETKLETDRRRIYGRIHDLEEQLQRLQQQRKLQRKERQANHIPKVSLVGYTNAGKSTLLNALSGSEEVLAEDKLFATLDPTTRAIEIASAGGNHQEILLTDTVGFIQKLPHTLVKAFQATLEETLEADLLLQVVDSGNPHYELQIKAVLEVLKEIGAEDKPMLYVFNKVDTIVPPEGETLDSAIFTRLQGREGVAVSACRHDDVELLRQHLGEFFSQGMTRLKLLIPYTQGGMVAELHKKGTVISEEYAEEGTLMEVELPADMAEQFQALVI